LEPCLQESLKLLAARAVQKILYERLPIGMKMLRY
jgi:hypothetical protein